MSKEERVRERRRDYELLFIISPLQSGEEQIQAVIERVQQVVGTIGGEILSTNTSSPWGRRKLAYSIREYAEGEASRRNFTEGFYVLITFSAGSTQLGELERSLKLNDAVLRYMITLVEKQGRSALDVEPEVVSETSSEDEAEGDE
jgi:small subunit ribosomal protein S6